MMKKKMMMMIKTRNKINKKLLSVIVKVSLGLTKMQARDKRKKRRKEVKTKKNIKNTSWQTRRTQARKRDEASKQAAALIMIVCKRKFKPSFSTLCPAKIHPPF